MIKIPNSFGSQLFYIIGCFLIPIGLGLQFGFSAVVLGVAIGMILIAISDSDE